MGNHVAGGTGFVYTPGFAQRSGTENRFFREDWLGSTRSTTNLQTGAVKGTHQWDALGQRSATGSGEFQGSSFMWGGGGRLRAVGRPGGVDYDDEDDSLVRG
jgi:hypothetical protein